MADEATSRDYDVAVVGGGLLGASIAWGLARRGERVVVLDEGDITKRASRANFALVWVQSKGLGMSEYTQWTVRSSKAWPRLADALKQQTGLDVALQQPGGLHLALSDGELEKRRDMLRRLHNQPGAADYKVEILDRRAVERMLPGVGPDVVGGTYCPLDGHVNSLRLFRALHTGFRMLGGTYLPEHAVSGIEPLAGGGFRIATENGAVSAGKVVLAAGNANRELAPLVGLSAPMKPNRGQIIVTERLKPFLHYPVTTLRQTDEGTVMIGDSLEDRTVDTGMTLPINAVMADRARRMFPMLARANVVRTWAGVRVMTADGFPIYNQSESCPGAFVACCHSGVTLAANHADEIAGQIAAGRLDPALVGAFSAERFDVQTAA
ncbi:MAG TPA: FAD-dependent oxidoreductase [Hyphomicrobiaceae bacterium]|nr:FAD-dependent oxidoreductase [Hyphomicrobiaceae bacterium]